MAASREDAARERLAQEWMDRWLHWPIAKEGGLPAFISTIAGEVLARQREREGPLVEALKEVKEMGFDNRGGFGLCHVSMREVADCALKAHAALDAPPPRTLAEVAADVVAQEAMTGPFAVVVPKALLDELAAALEREKEAKR